MATTLCPRCDQVKPLDDFPAHKNRKGGRGGFCRPCAAQAKRDSVAKHRERHLAARHAYYLSHRDEHKAYQTAYRQLNAEAERAYKRAYRAAHAEELRQYRMQYRANNLEQHRTHEHQRRARKAGAGGSHTATDVRAQFIFQNGRCHYCGADITAAFHIDHVIPLARGGSNGPENIVCACPPCNLSKGDRMPGEWSSPRLIQEAQAG